jgi:hypothetical protein
MKAYGYVEAIIFTFIFFLSRGCSQLDTSEATVYA